MAKNNEERKVRVVADGKQATATIKQMQAAVALLNAEMKKLPVNSQAFTNKKKEYQELQARLRQTTNEVYQLDRASKSFWKDFKSLAGAVVGGNLITGLMNQMNMLVQSTIKSKLELAEAMVDVQKVTGMTNTEIEKLNGQLSAIDTATGRKELLGLAYEAGKLGKSSVEDVAGFVRAADKIKVALGQDLGEGATQAIGKLVSIFQIEGEFGLEKGMLKIGSAINEIGAASTASEGYLVEFAKRMSGVSGIVGLSAADIIGMAGTLDSLGQTAEVSSTALSKLFVKMGSDTATFAKYAGMSMEQFSSLLKEDAMEAFVQVLGGVEKTAGGVEALSATLGELGLDGGRVVGVLGSLSKNVSELRRQQGIANEAFEKGDSILNEFNKKNQSASASVTKLYKSMMVNFTNSSFMTALYGSIVSLSRFVKGSDEAVSSMEKQRTELLKLQIELSNANIQYSRKVEIIDQLKQQFPEYAEMLNADATSQEALLLITKELNDELVKKIRLRRKEIELEEINSEIADNLDKKTLFEEKLADSMKKLLDQYPQFNLQTLKGNNLLEKSIDLRDKLIKLNDTKDGIFYQFSDAHKLDRYIYQINELDKQTSKLNTQVESTVEKISKINSEGLKPSGMLGPLPSGLNAMGPKNMVSGAKEPTTNTSTAPVELTSLIKQIRDARTALIKDLNEKERQALKDKMEDEKEAVQKSVSLASEKNTLLKLIDAKYLQDLANLKDKQAAESKEAELKAKTEALAEFEAIEKLYYAKMVENGQMTQKEQAQWNKQVDIAILEEKKRLYEEYGKSVAEIDLALAEARIKISKDESDKQRLSAIAEQQYRVAAEREGSRARLQEELELLDMEMQAELNAHILTEEQKKLIEDAFRQQKADKEKAHARQMVELAQQYIGEIANIYGSFMAIKSNKEEGEFNQYKTQEEAKKAKLEERLSKGLISEKGYRHQLEAIDKDLREREKQFKTEQFIRQKRADMISAGINTALAVTRALSTDPTGILATIVGIAGAAQIAAINSKPVPQFAMGGRTDVVGSQDGKKYSAKQVGSFANGGAYSNASVGLIGEKGPELVVPSWIYTAPSMAGVMDVLETMISTKQFAMGGATSTQAPVMQMPQSTDNSREMMLMIKTLQSIDEKLDKPFIAKTLWNQTEFERIQHIEEVSKKKSTLK